MRRKTLGWLPALFLFGLLSALGLMLLESYQSETFQPASEMLPTFEKFALHSPAFEEGQLIPAQYTCQGENISPPLTWGDPPPGTQSLALLVEDPDAPVGLWTHWIVYNLSSEVRSLPPNFQLESEARTVSFAKNSWGKRAYGGPCPPSGTHHYIFKLYALDRILPTDIQDREDLLQAMQGHILTYAELTGLYYRQ